MLHDGCWLTVRMRQDTPSHLVQSNWNEQTAVSRCQTVPVCSVRCDMVTWHTDTTTTNTAMVSRRKILSQSRDELSYVQEEEEDVWYTKDKLYKVNKWSI